MLFPSYTRNNNDIKKQKETAFEFIDRSAWKISDWIRQKINEMCSDYKVDDEFIKMFKSKSERQHYSAVFELLTYSVFIHSGFSIIRHPETPTGKKPDFKATINNLVIFLECTLSGHSFYSQANKKRKDTIEKIFNKIEYFPYWIDIKFHNISNKNVSERKFLNFLNRVKEFNEKYPNEHSHERIFLFEDNGWEIEISMLRKTDQNIKQSLGSIFEDVKVINTSKPILTALNDKKASRYGIETEPYIICINTNDFFPKGYSFAEILFGQNGNNEIDIKHLTQNGFFLASGKPINTSVSAVIIFKNFDLYTLDSTSIEVWHNPFAKNKIDINILPFDEYIYVVDNMLLKKNTIKKDKNIFEILEINKEEYLTLKEKRIKT